MRTTFYTNNCRRNRVSYSELKQRRQFEQFKKNYNLRERECEFHRDQLENAYERALESQSFGIDLYSDNVPKQKVHSISPRNYTSTTNFKTTTPYKYEKQIPSTVKNFKSIPVSPYVKNTFKPMPTVSNYSSARQYYTFDSPKTSSTSQYSGSRKVSIYNFKIPSANVEYNSNSHLNQNSQFVENSKMSSSKLSKKVSSQTDELHLDYDHSAINPLINKKQQPSRMETIDFDNMARENHITMQDQATNTSIYSNKDDSGVGANPFAFSGVQNSPTRRVPPPPPSNKNDSSFEMMPELHASDLESTVVEEEEIDNQDENEMYNNHSTHNEDELQYADELTQIDMYNEEESQHEEYSTQINILNEEEELNQFTFTEQEEEDQVQRNMDLVKNEEEEIDDEVYFDLNITDETKSNTNINSEIDANNSYRSSKNKSVVSSDNLEFSKKMDVVAHNLQSFSSNLKTGSSSNPHSQMLNESENEKNSSQKKNSLDALSLTPNREIFARRAIQQNDGEFSIAHSASSELSAVVFTQNDSISNSEESTSIDGIPRPQIDSPMKGQ